VNILSKIFKLAQGVKTVWNWVIAGLPFVQKGQSWIPAVIQDARWDFNYVTRRELMRKARFIAQNTTIARRIMEVDEVFTVGSNGLHVDSLATDEDWRDRAMNVWLELAASCGIEGQSLTDLVKVGFKTERTDGEAFFIKTRRPWTAQELERRGQTGDSRRVVGSRPCLQAVESHRVETPFNKWNDGGLEGILDGVIVKKIKLSDGTERQVKDGFWIRNSIGNFETEDTWTAYPLDAVMQIGDSYRVNEWRHVSAFQTACLDCVDLKDLLDVEMLAAKDGAETSKVLTTASGEQSAAQSIKQQLNPLLRNQAFVNDGKEWNERLEIYNKVLGRKTVSIRPGEKYEQFRNERPSVTSREHWLFRISLVCAGLGVSVLLVFPDFSDNRQGTAVRAELDIADELFKARQRKWKQFYRDTWEYLMGWAIKNDLRVADPPANWREIEVHSPRACNVDVGNNAQADQAALADGRLTYATYYGRQGKSWRRELSQVKIEQDFCEKNKLKRTITQRGVVVLGEVADIAGDENQPQENDDSQPPNKRGAKQTQNA
jgi:hypothetical protein